MCGATGLDYTALPVVMQMCGVAAGEQAAVFADIRVMEDAALKAFHEQRKSG
ncbi:phage protein [Pseudomonas aeruginosa]|nr:phage protein [Pseudomonas aeruginosa]